MRFWLDCEWNGDGGDLISIALVNEHRSGQFYEVVGCASPVPWVAENVMPVLGKTPDEWASIGVLRERLFKFLAPYETVQITADWPEDIARFCMLLIVGDGMRINTPPLSFEIDRNLDSVKSRIPHNALEDALALRASDGISE